MLRLDSDVQYVKGVGPRRSEFLKARGIRTVEDLLLHIPKAYQDRASFVPLSSLKVGQETAIHARVYRSRVIQTRTRGRSWTSFSRTAPASLMRNGFTADIFRELASSPPAVHWCSSAAWISIATNRRSYFSILSSKSSMMVTNSHRSTSADRSDLRGMPASRAASSGESFPALSQLGDEIDDPLPEDIRTANGFPDLKPVFSEFTFRSRPTMSTGSISVIRRIIAVSFSKSSFCWS